MSAADKHSSAPDKHPGPALPRLVFIVSRLKKALGTGPKSVQAGKREPAVREAAPDDPVDALTLEVGALEATLGAVQPKKAAKKPTG